MDPLVLCVVCGTPQRGYVHTTSGWICRSDWSRQTASYRVVTIDGIAFRVVQTGTGRVQRPEWGTKGKEGSETA